MSCVVRGKRAGVGCGADEPVACRAGLLMPGSTGSQRVAGATDGRRRELARAGAALVERRHASCANCRRPSARSAGLSSNCTSFSASANVAGETGGPTAGAVPKAGGAPGGGAADSGEGLRQAAVPAMRAAEARLRNCRRELGMVSPNHIVAGAVSRGETRRAGAGRRAANLPSFRTRRRSSGRPPARRSRDSRGPRSRRPARGSGGPATSLRRRS